MRGIDKENESAALALMAQEPSFCAQYHGSLHQGFFTDDIRADTFRLLHLYYGKYKCSVNPKALGRMAKTFPWSSNEPKHKSKVKLLLNKVANLPVDIADGPVIFDKLHSDFRFRRLYEAHDEGITLLKKGDLDGAEKALSKISGSLETESYEVIDFVEDFQDRLTAVDAPVNQKMQDVIQTGIKPIDKSVLFKKSQLMLVAAKTGGGKSISLQDMAMHNVLNGKRVAIVTNEMTHRETAFRCDSRISNIDHSCFNSLNLDTSQRKAWVSAMQKIKKDRCWIIQMPFNCTVGRCMSVFDEQGIEPEFVLFDYIHKMQPALPKGNWEDQVMVAEEMKNAGIDRHFAVATACQLKPDAYTLDRLEIEDLAISKYIAYVADLIWAIIHTKRLELKGKARIQFLKGRHGFSKEVVDIYPDFGVVRVHSDKKQKQLKNQTTP
jgi:hypothetical protein